MAQTSCYPTYDRFIGYQSNHLDFGLYSVRQTSFQGHKSSSYEELIRKNLFGSKTNSQQESTKANQKYSHTIRNLDINLPECNVKNQLKNVLSPVKILDVPNIKDDFYLNLIDWHERGPIGIALNDEAYIYTPKDTVRLTKGLFSTYISSLKFNQSILSVGFSNGMVQIFDLEKNNTIRSIKNHSLRVSSIAFSQNTMITGSKDKFINYNDLRIKQCLIKSNQGHNGQICSLKVKPDQKNIFASGANDCKVLIWDIRNDLPISALKGHKGAVKAISWCPWKSNTLATGGGNNDRTIKIWNQNMKLVCQKQLKSQISGLQWNSKQKCLISSHGSNSNEICLWNWDGNRKLSKVNGSKNYSKRVLNLIQSKQQDMVCTLSSDETLKFFQLQNCLGQGSQKQIFDSHSSNNEFQRIL